MLGMSPCVLLPGFPSLSPCSRVWEEPPAVLFRGWVEPVLSVSFALTFSIPEVLLALAFLSMAAALASSSGSLAYSE